MPTAYPTRYGKSARTTTAPSNRPGEATPTSPHWMTWFLQCLDRALTGAETTIQHALEKARFWQSIAHVAINDRQRRVVNLLLDGIQGNLTASRWARIARSSQETALSDICYLVEQGILSINPVTGPNTTYRLREAGTPD